MIKLLQARHYPYLRVGLGFLHFLQDGSASILYFLLKSIMANSGSM